MYIPKLKKAFKPKFIRKLLRNLIFLFLIVGIFMFL